MATTAKRVKDAKIQKKFDDGLASAEHGKLQKLRGTRRGGEDVRRMLHQLPQRRGVPAARQRDRLDRRLVAQAYPMRPRAQRRGLLPLVDQRHRQNADFILDRAPRINVRHRRVERVTEMREPPLGKRARDGQQMVAMRERHVGAVAVGGVTAQPLNEEALLRLTLVDEIAVEQRPQHWVGLDPLVEPIDQRCDRGMASDAPEETATSEGVVPLRASKKSAVFH